MTRYLLLFFTLFIFGACSFTTPKNDWQLKSVNAYESYQSYFLKNEQNLADADLKRALKYAKQSADLDTLARIELSRCALHVSVLENRECGEYLELEPVASSAKLHSYYLFLQNKDTKSDSKELPSRYKAFARYKEDGDYENAQKELLKMEDTVSKMISASLIKDSLHRSTIKSIIDEASFSGYKKAVINWMRFYLEKTTDVKERDLIEKKLKIIND